MAGNYKVPAKHLDLEDIVLVRVSKESLQTQRLLLLPKPIAPIPRIVPKAPANTELPNIFLLLNRSKKKTRAPAIQQELSFCEILNE